MIHGTIVVMGVCREQNSCHDCLSQTLIFVLMPCQRLALTHEEFALLFVLTIV
jgi:hypothetical protein